MDYQTEHFDVRSELQNFTTRQTMGYSIGVFAVTKAEWLRQSTSPLFPILPLSPRSTSSFVSSDWVLPLFIRHPHFPLLGPIVAIYDLLVLVPLA